MASRPGMPQSFALASIASASSAAMRPSARLFCSMRTMDSAACPRNQRSIFVMSWMCCASSRRGAAPPPRRTGTRGRRRLCSLRSPIASSLLSRDGGDRSGSSHCPSPSERTALSSAFSKFVPMAMISPVAFIFGADVLVGIDEFVERPAREFEHAHSQASARRRRRSARSRR